MTKHDAVMILIRDGHRLRQSVDSNRRMITALKVLGLEGQELLRTGNELELWKANGDPYLHRDPRSPSFAEASAAV